MSEWIDAVLRTLLEVLAGAAVREPSALAVAVFALAAVAVLVLAVALRDVALGAAGSPPHPLRAIDISVQPAQSHPDAAGHPRPRAPGRAAPAA